MLERALAAFGSTSGLSKKGCLPALAIQAGRTMIQSRSNSHANGQLGVNFCHFQGWLCGASWCSTVTRRKGRTEGCTAYDPHKQKLGTTAQPAQPHRARPCACTRVKLHAPNSISLFFTQFIKRGCTVVPSLCLCGSQKVQPFLMAQPRLYP